ncbi:MAG: hypothetical protein ABIO19_06940 [Burkholderiaceae bacterium]
MSKQRGLSLLWCAILMALLSVAAMAALFSLRHERNLPAELRAWASQTAAATGLLQRVQVVLPTAQSAAAGAQPTTVRRCTVNGTVLYSNVDCDLKKSGSKAVELHFTQGIDAPKVPAAAAAAQRFGDGFPEMPAGAPALSR